MPQRLNRIHLRRAGGGVQAEHHADEDRNPKCQRNRPNHNDRLDRLDDVGQVVHLLLEEPLENLRADKPNHRLAEQAAENPRQPADRREQCRLDKELSCDIALFRAEGAADADLTRSFRDGGKHDIHDADPADDERNRCDEPEQNDEHDPRVLRLLEQFQRDGHHIIFHPMPIVENPFHVQRRVFDVFLGSELQRDLAQFQILRFARRRVRE